MSRSLSHYLYNSIELVSYVDLNCIGVLQSHDKVAEIHWRKAILVGWDRSLYLILIKERNELWKLFWARSFLFQDRRRRKHRALNWAKVTLKGTWYGKEILYGGYDWEGTKICSWLFLVALNPGSLTSNPFTFFNRSWFLPVPSCHCSLFFSLANFIYVLPSPLPTIEQCVLSLYSLVCEHFMGPVNHTSFCDWNSHYTFSCLTRYYAKKFILWIKMWRLPLSIVC
jgi:hypothetical protein